MTATPAERSLQASMAVHEMWARCDDRVERTAKARRGFNRKFEDEVDPDRVLPAAERAIRADHARKAHMKRLALFPASLVEPGR